MKLFTAIALLAGIVTVGQVVQTSKEHVMPISVQTIKEKHEAKLLAMPGVVSVGIGQDVDGAALIIIGISSEDAQLIAELPNKLEGIAVKVQLIGAVQARD
jgi:hypothetical protein